MDAIQLDFFEDNDELTMLKKEIILLRESQHKVRKNLFAKHSELAKMYMENVERLDNIERMLKI